MTSAAESEPRASAVRRILTIDGGGIKGVFPASFLAELEAHLGQPIVEYFDLIAGTSTGGIIALALGFGLSARQILELYEKNGRRIFPHTMGFTLPGVFRAKYAKAALPEVLKEVFGDLRLGNSRVRLLIPSLNLATEYVHIYKTSHHPTLVNDYKVPAVEVAMATVAAPTYFPIHLSPDGVPFIDGSVWAVNPAGLAVIEAIGILGWPRESIRILSLGCTTTHLAISWTSWEKHTSLGASFWAARLADIFMKAQSSSAIVTANVLVGAQNVFRIDPDTSQHHLTLDGVQHMPFLRELGQREASAVFDRLASTFFTEKAPAFVPCHRLALAAPAPSRLTT